MENRLATGKCYARDLCCLNVLIQKGEATEADIKEYNKRVMALKEAKQNKNRRA